MDTPKIVEYRYHPDHGEACGYFTSEAPDIIYINVRCKKLQREHTIAHEKKHRECFLSGCSCWSKGTDFLTEYHAFKAEFEYVLNSGCRRLQREYLKNIRRSMARYNKYPERYPSHRAALNKVMGLKAFRQMRERLGVYWIG